jgi:hypothetical protein
MTISAGILLALGLLDIILFLIAYGTNYRIRRFQEAYNRGFFGG